nr:PREDICTED: uncharacterized protein LOC103549458 [Equus przewalskii]
MRTGALPAGLRRGVAVSPAAAAAVSAAARTIRGGAGRCRARHIDPVGGRAREGLPGRRRLRWRPWAGAAVRRRGLQDCGPRGAPAVRFPKASARAELPQSACSQRVTTHGAAPPCLPKPHLRGQGLSTRILGCSSFPPSQIFSRMSAFAPSARLDSLIIKRVFSPNLGCKSSLLRSLVLVSSKRYNTFTSFKIQKDMQRSVFFHTCPSATQFLA